MPSPFPGMDPYLERPGLWPDVHHGLISQIQAELSPLVRPKYAVGVESRVYISDDDDTGRRVMVPDIRIATSAQRRGSGRRAAHHGPAAIAAPETITLLNEEIAEAYIEIRDPRVGVLVTIIEVLSPTNKLPGSSGRTSFLAKRRDVLNSRVNWVEVDLLRAGKPASLNPELTGCDYRIIVSRKSDRNNAGYWRLGIRQALPVIGIPLRNKDADVPLDLARVLRSAYDRAGWDLRVDYSRPPDPPLNPADTRWANKLLRQKGFR